MFKFTLGVRLGIQGDRTFQSGAAGYGEAGQPALWILLGWTVKELCVPHALCAARSRETPAGARAGATSDSEPCCLKSVPPCSDDRFFLTRVLIGV